MLLLCSCGDAIDLCDDNNKIFPVAADFPKNVSISKRIAVEVSDDKLITKYENLPAQEQLGRTALEYAHDTSLKTTAKLGKVKFEKLFDGVISCSTNTPNSRLNLYQSGIDIVLNKRLKDADRVGMYMTSSSLILKMRATISLYKLVDASSSTKVYEAYDFSFNCSLYPNTTAPYFYSFLLSSLPINVDDIKDTAMIGLSYRRLVPNDEETKTGNYFPYIEDETESDSFIKVYDISLPFSSWY